MLEHFRGLQGWTASTPLRLPGPVDRLAARSPGADAMTMSRRQLDPYTRERREPMELLARLAGGTTFLSAGAGRGGPTLTALDVAYAVAASPEKLGAAVANAIVCQRPQDWPIIHELGYPRMLADLRQQQALPGVVTGALSFRARITLCDAFHDLVLPRQRRKWKQAIEDSGVPERAYRFLHKTATGLLQAWANTAARDACSFLFASDGLQRDGAAPARHVIALASDHGDIRVWRADGIAELSAAVRADVDDRAALLVLAELVRDAAARGQRRATGTLSLRGDSYSATYSTLAAEMATCGPHLQPVLDFGGQNGQFPYPE